MESSKQSVLSVKPDAIGIPSWSTFTHTWLQSLGQGFIMMDKVVPPPMPFDWSMVASSKPRFPSLRAIVDHAALPGPPGFRDSSWCSMSCCPINQEDVAVWPYSVNTVLEFTTFWPQHVRVRSRATPNRATSTPHPRDSSTECNQCATLYNVLGAEALGRLRHRHSSPRHEEKWTRDH